MRAAHRPAAPIAELTRQFLEAEIELALTFLATARTEYRYGDVERGDLAKRKAAQACAEVERRLHDEQGRGKDVGELRSRWDRLQAAVVRFSEEEWKVA